MGAIELDRFLPHPPSTVWRALTDPALLARWLMPNDFEPRVGHRFTFRRSMAGEAGTVHCEVLQMERDRLLTISWRGRRTEGSSVLDSTVTWRLEPEGTGTRLSLTHSGFDERDPDHRKALDAMRGGWGRLLDAALPAVLDEAPPG